MRLFLRPTNSVVFAAPMLALLAALSALAAPGDTAADRVFGQAGNFATNLPNMGGANPSATSLSNPNAEALDSSGRLYVADFANQRVLEYDTPPTSQTATRVFGQAGSFTTNTANKGGISANSLYYPSGVALDGAGRLYVADQQNNRVLEYDSPLTSQTATRVFGQAGSFTTNTANNGGISANSLYGPAGLSVGTTGRLYVADWSNNRVLEYDTPLTSQTATRVFGQAGSFTTNTANNGGVTASAFFNPSGLALDGAGNLYVADFLNSRILEFNAPPSVGGIAEEPGVQALTSAAPSSGRDYAAYILGAAFVLVVAAAGAVSWRRRRG